MGFGKFRSARRWIGEWLRRQPWPLKLLLLVVPLVIGKIVDRALDGAAGFTGWGQWEVALAVVALFALIAAISLPFHRLAPTDPLPPLDLEAIEVRRVFPKDELEKIRTGLHQDIYGGVAPTGDEITRMYERNPRMGVALFDPAREDYVAFATGWPLVEDVARKLMAGTITENDLTADDVLPESGNARARFVLVPAFGAAGADKGSERALLGLKLNTEFRRALRQNFFASRSRRLTLIATGFSAKGRDWCRTLGMKECCCVVLRAGEPGVPVFAREIGWADVE